MERFPDQSQVNLFLNRMTAENLAQLEHAHQELLHSHSLLRSAERVVMDFDQIRLRVTGKRFEFAEKGYFPRRRGARGYQLSAALASAEGYEPEAITERWRSARTNGVRAATPDVCDITRELGSRKLRRLQSVS